MNAQPRKIQKVGNSAAVLLPKEWLDLHRLKPGSRIRLIVSEDRIVILSDEPEREVKVDAAFRGRVDRILKRERKVLDRLS